MLIMCSAVYKQSSIQKAKVPKKLISSRRKVYVCCLQSLEELKALCERLGLKFVDCTKSEKYLEVEMILDHKPGIQHDMYLVKWKNYSCEFNSWEPQTHLFGCEDLIYYYRALSKPPKRLTSEIVWCFIRDLLTCVPRDSLTLKKLCSLIYGFSEEYIDSLQLTFPELKCKVLRVLDISIKRLNKVKDKLVNLMQFSHQRKYILIKIREWESKINEFTSPYVKVENNVDLEEPPLQFQFIQDYVSSNIDLSEKPVVYCKCDNCYDDRDSCCSNVFDGHFAYNKDREVVLSPGNRIFECNKLCKCPPDCSNRVVQHGQKVKLAIFRTSNGCGWGLKTLEKIQKGQFVMEYLGEIITSGEAEERGEIYDYRGHSYLFDLDCDEQCLYTVDGGHMGNASHFINHSCEPNMQVFTVWINQHNPNLPRLAFFAKKKINIGDELTFDYKMVDTRTKSGITVPDEERVLCRCNTKNCRKYLF